MKEKYCSIIQIYILSISLHIQNLIEIHKLIHKRLSINKILTSIKGHNSVKNWPKIMCIRYNMDLVYKIRSKFIHFFWRYWGKSHFTSIKGHTLLFLNEFSPFAIPNYSFLISMSMPSFKKIDQNLLKLESGNEALTDGRTLKQFGGYNIIPRHFLCDGV